jgi:hypothetical protein
MEGIDCFATTQVLWENFLDSEKMYCVLKRKIAKINKKRCFSKICYFLKFSRHYTAFLLESEEFYKCQIRIPPHIFRSFLGKNRFLANENKNAVKFRPLNQ